MAGGRVRWLAGLLWLVGLVGGYLFVTFRWPERPYYAPEFHRLRGYAAHGGAAAAALVASLVLFARVAVPRLGTLASVAVALVLLPEAMFRLGDSNRERPEGPNLILISLDTLRADRLGCYGYELPTSPEIDRFARDAFVFTQAFSPQPFTLTAHMTMMTSLYPTAHGVDKEVTLSRDVPTLPAILSREGYSTLAVVDRGHWLSEEYGFARGFDVYERISGSAELKLDRLFDLLDDQRREPFFLFAHFFDVHSDYDMLPYEAEPADVEEFAGWYEGEFNGCGANACASEFLHEVARRQETLSEEDLAYVSSLYDAGIRSLDRHVGRLLDELESRGLFENSVILLTADHGEEFFEHGLAMHGQVYDECLNVPFMVRLPGGSPGTSDELVGLVDVMPTFLSFLGVEAEGIEGASLRPLITGESLKPVHDHVLLDPRKHGLGIRTRDWALVPTEDGIGAFDLRHDPGQTLDLHRAATLPPEIDELYRLLEREADRQHALRDQFAPGAPMREVTQEEQDRLRALGYGGG